ncbi:uncharacterized protein RBU57_010545 isoform 2-T3 [Macrochelys suwanniensis]
MSYRMMSRCLMLLVVSNWALKTVEAQERRTVGVGSSVLLTALTTHYKTVIKHIQWEYVNSTTTANIVDYYGTGTEPIIAKRYEDRVMFYSSNGSLLLKNVQETDNGTYRATINLNKIKARQTTLLVLEPMSKAQLQINSTVVGSPVELSCKVLVGKVQAIEWKKDGKPLPRNRCYQLSENFSLLYIPEAQKSDCGSFSCNASNDINWQETSANLTIEGIVPSSLKHALKMSTVALAISITLAAGSGLGFIILCCQSEKKKITGELWRWLVIFTHGLVCVSAILMFTAAVFWMWEEGLSTALVLYMIFLTWVIMVTLLLSVVLAICPQHLGMFKKKTMYRVILDTAAPGGVILVVLFAIFLTQNIQHLQRKGCTPFFDSTAAILIAAAISLLILLAPFVWYHRKKKSQEKDQQEGQHVEVRMQCPSKTERSLNLTRTFLSFQYFKTIYNCLCKYMESHTHTHTHTHTTIV